MYALRVQPAPHANMQRLDLLLDVFPLDGGKLQRELVRLQPSIVHLEDLVANERRSATVMATFRRPGRTVLSVASRVQGMASTQPRIDPTFDGWSWVLAQDGERIERRPQHEHVAATCSAEGSPAPSASLRIVSSTPQALTVVVELTNATDRPVLLSDCDLGRFSSTIVIETHAPRIELPLPLELDGALTRLSPGARLRRTLTVRDPRVLRALLRRDALVHYRLAVAREPFFESGTLRDAFCGEVRSPDSVIGRTTGH